MTAPTPLIAGNWKMNGLAASLDEARATIEKFKQLMTLHETTLDENGEPENVDLRALGEIAALQGVVKFPVRIKCAILAWNTLSQGLDEVPTES